MDTETRAPEGAETNEETETENREGEESQEGQEGQEGQETKPEGTNESTFGKPGEIVQKAVSGMEHATVSGEDREKPRARVRHNQDLEQPRPKKSHPVMESPTSTHPVHVSPAFGADGPREHND